MLALVGLFLGCALQAVKSRERIQDDVNDEYNGLQRDLQELMSPDEVDEGEEDDTDDMDGDDDDDFEADGVDDDDDDNDNQNDEELGEYQR